LFVSLLVYSIYFLFFSLSIAFLVSISSTFLRTNFLYKRHFSSFYYLHATRKSWGNDVRTKNSYVKRWWNWHLFTRALFMFFSLLSVFPLLFSLLILPFSVFLFSFTVLSLFLFLLFSHSFFFILRGRCYKHFWTPKS